jgi:AcrR family transcriptional regulator
MSEKSKNTKIAIIETARKLFSDADYLNVSMSDIAKKLKITKAALYYHFTGKTEIYKNVLDNVFNNFNSFLNHALKEKGPSKKLYKLIKYYLDFNLKEKNLVKALTIKNSFFNSEIIKYITKIRKKIFNLFKENVEKLLKEKMIKNNPQILTTLLINMMNGLILETLIFNKKINTGKNSKYIISTLF